MGADIRPVLTRYNYPDWRASMTRELERNELRPFIEYDKDPGSPQASATLCLILASLDNFHAVLVIDCFTAYQVWKYLEKRFETCHQKDRRGKRSSCSPSPTNPERYYLKKACSKCRKIVCSHPSRLTLTLKADKQTGRQR